MELSHLIDLAARVDDANSASWRAALVAAAPPTVAQLDAQRGHGASLPSLTVLARRRGQLAAGALKRINALPCVVSTISTNCDVDVVALRALPRANVADVASALWPAYYIGLTADVDATKRAAAALFREYGIGCRVTFGLGNGFEACALLTAPSDPECSTRQTTTA